MTTATAELWQLADFEETRPDHVLPECLHSIHDTEHYETCLGLRCPICGLTEDTGYRLRDHDPYSFGHVYSCSITQALIDQNGCCLACRRYTFGHRGGCQWEECPLYVPGHHIDHFKRNAVCELCGVGPRVVFQIGAW